MVDRDDLPSLALARAASHEAAGELVEARAAYFAAALLDPHSSALAEFLERMDRLEESRREWMRLFRQAQKRGDAAGESAACRRLAALSRERGDYVAANSWQQRALAAFFDAGGAALPPEDLIARASDWMIAGELTAAEKLLRRVIDAAKAAGDGGSEADATGTLGLVHGRGGRLALAARFFFRAALLHRRLGDHRGAATDFLNLTEVFRLAERLRAATLCVRLAMRAARRSGNWRHVRLVAERARELRRIATIRSHRAEWN